MEVAPILDDLRKMFAADERISEGLSPTSDRTYFVDEKITAENRLRRLVGAPMVARKSGR